MLRNRRRSSCAPSISRRSRVQRKPTLESLEGKSMAAPTKWSLLLPSLAMDELGQAASLSLGQAAFGALRSAPGGVHLMRMASNHSGSPILHATPLASDYFPVFEQVAGNSPISAFATALDPNPEVTDTHSGSSTAAAGLKYSETSQQYLPGYGMATFKSTQQGSVNNVVEDVPNPGTVAGLTIAATIGQDQGTQGPLSFTGAYPKDTFRSGFSSGPYSRAYTLWNDGPSSANVYMEEMLSIHYSPPAPATNPPTVTDVSDNQTAFSLISSNINVLLIAGNKAQYSVGLNSTIVSVSTIIDNITITVQTPYDLPPSPGVPFSVSWAGAIQTCIVGQNTGDSTNQEAASLNYSAQFSQVSELK